MHHTDVRGKPKKVRSLGEILKFTWLVAVYYYSLQKKMYTATNKLI